MNLRNSLTLVAVTAAILWAISVPVWHFPDEQAHFAQVQNYSEIGGSPASDDDLSFEVYETERMLGTLRDERGNNKFTYSPDFKIEYSTNRLGIYEEYLKELPKSLRTTYVKNESPRYPPLFYEITGFGYRLFYDEDIFSRVIGVRLMSVIIFGGIVYFAWLLSAVVFVKNIQVKVAATMMIAFHPMYMFVSSGINNDTLLNLSGVAILYFLMKMIRSGVVIMDVFWLFVWFSVGVLAKQLIFLMLPMMGLVLGWLIIRSKISKKLLGRLVLAAGGGLLLALLILKNEGFWLPFWPSVTEASPGYSYTVFELVKSQLIRMYRETLPWYWGVYKWLGVVLPLNLLRFIKLMMVVSGLGWIKYLKLKTQDSKLQTLDWQMIWLAIGSLLYVVIFMTWDVQLTRHMGFGHGIQGRYFFPLLPSHMILLVYGWWMLIKGLKIKRIFGLLVSLFIIGLNLFSLYWVMGHYYDLWPMMTFMNQLSQYKPEFAKWPYVGVYLGAYITALGILIRKVAMLRGDNGNGV